MTTGRKEQTAQDNSVFGKQRDKYEADYVNSFLTDMRSAGQ